MIWYLNWFPVCFLFVFISYLFFQFNPFALGLENIELAVSPEDSNPMRQLIFSLFFFVSLSFVSFSKVRLQILFNFVRSNWLQFAFFGFVIFSFLWSPFPFSTLKRSILLFMVSLSCLFIVISLGVERFLTCITMILLIFLILSFIGVFLIPSAVHNISDVIDVNLAGTWRGIFLHKNTAGFCFSISIFLFFYRFKMSGRKLWLFCIFLALVFMVFSQSKTSLGLLFFSIAVLALLKIKPQIVGFARMVLALLVLLSVFLFFIFNEEVMAVLSDPSSFTGRSLIWQVLARAIMDKPILGFGYGSIWGMSDNSILQHYYNNSSELWVVSLVTSGHSSYLDILSTIGFLGLILFTFSFLVPVFNFFVRYSLSSERSRLYFLIVFFVVLHGFFETNFLYVSSGRWELSYMVFLCCLIDFTFLKSKEMVDNL